MWLPRTQLNRHRLESWCNFSSPPAAAWRGGQATPPNQPPACYLAFARSFDRRNSLVLKRLTNPIQNMQIFAHAARRPAAAPGRSGRGFVNLVALHCGIWPAAISVFRVDHQSLSNSRQATRRRSVHKTTFCALICLVSSYGALAPDFGPQAQN